MNLFFFIFVLTSALPIIANASEPKISNPIVDIALSQLGKADQDKNCPKAGCYGGAGRQWCSEFVSWVFKEAKVPFDGGKKQPWLLNDSKKIIRWFKANGKYIERSDPAWKTFKPYPGDYVFIGRYHVANRKNTREHSGIVEEVTANGTLKTIEGNNHNRPVARYTYPNYQTNDKDNGEANGIVLGFGRRKENL